MFKRVLEEVRQAVDETTLRGLFETGSRRFTDAFNMVMQGELTESNNVESVIEPGMRIRTSGLGNYMRCPRMIALMREHKVPLTGDWDERGVWAVNIGTAYHEFIQNRMNRMNLDNVAVLTFEGDVLSQEDDLQLITVWNYFDDDSDYRYNEFSYYSDRFNLTGHSDGVLAWRKPGVDVEKWRKAVHKVWALEGDPEPIRFIFENSEIEILEFKTIGDVSRVRETPKQDHIIQVLSYLYMLDHWNRQTSAGMDIRGARIVYIGKDIKSWQDFVEYNVIWNDDAKKRIEQILEGVREVIDRADPESLEILDQCTKKRGWIYRACPVRKLCRSTKAPNS